MKSSVTTSGIAGPALDSEPGRPRRILGIESSCDETGAAVAHWSVDAGGRPHVELVAQSVASSMDAHRAYGGVVPEIASRAHLESLIPVVHDALSQAGITRPDAVACTIGPGLAGALLVGVAGAKALAATWEVPFYGVNHLLGHVAVDTFEHGAADNVVALLVSGGHTQLLHVKGWGEPVVELGSTVDDAAGEAYDKVARLLGVGYPGGPVIDRLARHGDPEALRLPRGLTGPRDAPFDFSFSGLKTAVARVVEAAEREGRTLRAVDLAAGFQEAVADVLTMKAVKACQHVGSSVLVLGGGVAANSRVRSLAEERCAAAEIEVRVPNPSLCTDNGAMIAALGAHLCAAGAEPTPWDAATDPSLPVDVSVVGSVE